MGALPRRNITRRQNSLSNTPELNEELKYIPRLDGSVTKAKSPILTTTPTRSRKQLPPPSELDRNDLKQVVKAKGIPFSKTPLRPQLVPSPVLLVYKPKL